MKDFRWFGITDARKLLPYRQKVQTRTRLDCVRSLRGSWAPATELLVQDKAQPGSHVLLTRTFQPLHRAPPPQPASHPNPSPRSFLTPCLCAELSRPGRSSKSPVQERREQWVLKGGGSWAGVTEASGSPGGWVVAGKLAMLIRKIISLPQCQTTAELS